MARLPCGHFCAVCLLRKLFHLVLAAVMALLLSITSLFISIAQAINYGLFYKTSPNLQRSINAHLQDMLYSQITTVAEWYLGVRIRVFYADIKTRDMYPKEHALVVGNHGYQIDGIFYWLYAQMNNTLGTAKAYVKNDLRYMPVLGWAFIFGESIFLRRNWQKDLSTISPALDTFMENKPLAKLLLLPEGTRFTKEKHEMSLKFARERNIPHTYKYHLLPRVKGFIYTLRYLQTKYAGKFAIYNIEVIQRYEGDAPEPNVKNMIKGKSFQVDLYVERIDYSQMPPIESTDEEYTEFLYKMFDKMDKLAEDHKSYHMFPRCYMEHKKPSIYRLIQFIILNVGLSGSLVFYLIYTAITTHSLFLRCLIYGLTILAYSGLLLVLFLMQNSKYGVKSKSRSKPNGNSSAEATTTPTKSNVQHFD